MPTEKGGISSSSSPPPTDLPPSYENIITPNSNHQRTVVATPNASSSNPTLNGSAAIPSQNPIDALSRLAAINFARYCMSQAKLSDDHTTVTTSKPELLATQYVLVNFIKEQASLPPKPLMVVRGTHLGGWGGGHARHGEVVVDFELKLNLTSLLDLEAVDDDDGQSTRPPTRRIRVKPMSGPSSRPSRSGAAGSLEHWVRKFCEDKAENKSFTLHRHVANLPAQILEGMVRTLLAAARYRGKVGVDFPVQYADVTVLRQSGNWFTNMLRLYPTKKYEVVEAVWDVGATTTQGQNGSAHTTPGVGAAGSGGQRNKPHTTSSHSPSASDSNSGSTDPDGAGQAGLIAQAWTREWHFAIRNAVLQGRKGWVTVEDWIEAKMGMGMADRNRDWGVDYEDYQ